MYFKIFYTLIILFVASNLIIDLYNFYNTGAWEPFSATMEDNTKISKALIIGSGDWITKEFKKKSPPHAGQIIINFNKDTFEQLQQQFQPNMDENKKKEIKNLLDKPGGLVNVFRKYPQAESWVHDYFIYKIEDKLNSHFKTKDMVSKSEAINIISEITLKPENRKREFAENTYKEVLGNKNKGDEFNKKFFEELILPGGKKLNLDKQSSPQIHIKPRIHIQQQPNSGSGENSPQNDDKGWKQVGLEGDEVNCNGLVRYGANSDWVVKHSIGKIPCNNEVFGNHLQGINKTCECKLDNWSEEKRSESVTERIFTKDKSLCVDPIKGGYVNFTGEACGKNNNNIQWSNIYTPPDQASKKYNKTGCKFQLEKDEEILYFKNPSIRRNNKLKKGIELPYNYKVEFKYTPTQIQSSSTNILRITDKLSGSRNADSYKDRLFYVFKQGGKTDLEIGIGTKEGNFTWYTRYSFKKNKTYNILISIRNKEAKTYVNNKLINDETITGKRDIIKNCQLYMSDKWYGAARCKVEDLLLTSSGSDMKWVKKFMGKCGETPTVIGGELLHNDISELLRYDMGDKSQSVEWQAIGKEKQKSAGIPQPKPLRKLTSEYIPLIDDDNREWVPDYIDIANKSPTSNIHLGKYFSKKISNLRGFKLPDIYQSEYELIGGLVSRAESSKRRGASENEMVKYKKHIVKFFNELLGVETDSYTNINNKKRDKQYSGVPAYTQPDQSVKQQTNNMFSDNSNSKHKVNEMKTTYTTKYRPRDPREYPRPIDAAWSFLSNE
jgi:hypothetical protein